MGPPNQLASPNSKSNKGSQRGSSDHSRSRPLPLQKTSLELLLESTEMTQPFADAQQFGMVRDSLVFNHERILQHSPSFSPNHNENVQPARAVPQPHYPSVNTISSQTNNYMESSTPALLQDNEDQFATSPTFHSLSDRTAQNRANANLDRHIGWQLHQSVQKPPGFRGRIGSDFHPALVRTQMIRDISGDIPLTNTAASLHLPSPPTSKLFTGGMEPPPSATTVTTVYAYKCNRTGRHVDDEKIMLCRDNSSGPLYEESIQEMPYPYETGAQHPQLNFDRATPEDRGSEEEMDIQQEDKRVTGVEPTLNASNIQTVPVLSIGDYATDDDFDDDLMTPTNRQQQPFFPNPADLKWPDPAYLRLTLDPKYHPFIEPNCKKDCRSWLWKNEKGRQARKLIAEGKPLSNCSAPCHQRASTPVALNTKRAFSDNDGLDDDNDMVIRLQP